MRDETCPLCGAQTEAVLQLHFKPKMNLPTQPGIRYCALDEFMFVAAGSQQDYDRYYEAVANDSYHAEMAAGSLHSPIALIQKAQLLKHLSGFFQEPKKVFDFGCGEASLLLELASEFPESSFTGFDPSPGARIASQKAQRLGLRNLQVVNFEQSAAYGPYDLVIVSHVVEHLIDFDLIHTITKLLTHDGLLYIEVPDALNYREHERREFLYYLDRIHVNHFTPQALVRLLASYRFSCAGYFSYTFPYRDGGVYPALGSFFRRDEPTEISSSSLLDSVTKYKSSEELRARTMARQFEQFDKVLVWGTGDNFYRSLGNGGPLSNLKDVVLLDSYHQVIKIGDRIYETELPIEGIRRLSSPVVITISESTKALVEQIRQIDPSRPVFCI